MKPMDAAALARLQGIAGLRERTARAALSAAVAEERKLADEIAQLAGRRSGGDAFPPGAAGGNWHIWIARRREVLLGRLAKARARKGAAQRVYAKARAKAEAVNKLADQSRAERRARLDAHRQETLLHEAIAGGQRRDGYIS